MDDKITEGNFIFCSREIIEDSRLTLLQIKVLLALFSFRNKNTHLCFPSREAISKRTGIRTTSISRTTTQLVGLGWLLKFWDVETKKYNYRITVPELGGVHESCTIHESSTGGVHESCTIGVHESGTHNYKENYKGNLIIKPPPPENIPDWLELDIWDQFKIHRKHIRKPMSKYAEKLMLKKLEKAEQDGHDPNDLLSNAICAGWQGVVIPDKVSSKSQVKFPTADERRQDDNSWLKQAIEKGEHGKNEGASNSAGTGRILRELP